MMAGRVLTFQDLCNLALARAKVRGTPGRISITPDPVEPGSMQMWIDGELLARGLDSSEIAIASFKRPDGPLN
jgi:hypothetical protein